MLHPQVDIARWLARYTLDTHRAMVGAENLEFVRQNPDLYPQPPDPATIDGLFPHRLLAPSDIFSPRDLAVTEHYRAAAGGRGGPAALGPAVPTDLLLPALGKPQRRDLSKVGGLPYRPATLPWPMTRPSAYLRTSEPMTFLAQFNFADSAAALAHNGIDRLPGDVLLIFAPGEYCTDFDDADEGALHFEWHPRGLTDLICPDAIPEPRYKLTPTSFQLYRTTDHPSPPAPLDDDPMIMGIYWATKIGGVPFWQQEPEPHRGRFLAALHSIHPVQDEYPFPDVPTPPWGRWPGSMDFLMLGDVGTLHLFLTPDDGISWTIQCS